MLNKINALFETLFTTSCYIISNRHENRLVQKPEKIGRYPNIKQKRLIYLMYQMFHRVIAATKVKAKDFIIVGID
nr:hypothetical protein [Mucilaginibacter sp. FT3.2]